VAARPRDGVAAIRLGVAAAGLSTGVMECLRDGPVDTASVRRQLGLDDGGLLEPWLPWLQPSPVFVRQPS
jgi:hypothetical protein